MSNNLVYAGGEAWSDKDGQKSGYVIGCVANGCGELTPVEPGVFECLKCGERLIEETITE